MEIRPVQIHDLPVLRRIAIETQVDTFGEFNSKENMDAFLRQAYSIEQFQQELLEPGSVYYMAWEGEEAAGFLRLRLNNEAEPHLGENTIELQRLYIVKHFRGKHVGSLMMQHALDYARQKKYEWLWLGVWERNFKAQEFYKKWGFERFSEHIFLLGDDPQTDWLLKLKVS